jgi:hypothetical protein
MEQKQGSKKTIRGISAICAMIQIKDAFSGAMTKEDRLTAIKKIVDEYYFDQE